MRKLWAKHHEEDEAQGSPVPSALEAAVPAKLPGPVLANILGP